MHLSKWLAATSAALILAATTAMPQSAQAGAMVGFTGNYSAGTVVVKTGERSLYYVLGNGKAMRYTVGVGRQGKQWTGTSMIDGKHLAPAWSPPADVKRDNPKLPSLIAGGSPRNPMGAAALDAERRPIRHSRHQCARLDRRLRLLRLHPHVQRGCARSLQPRRLRNDGRRHPLICSTVRSRSSAVRLAYPHVESALAAVAGMGVLETNDAGAEFRQLEP